MTGSDLRLRSPAGRAVVGAAVLGSALAYMSDDMLNVALPTVASDLDVGVSEMQWVVNGYFVTMLSLMLTAGSVGDVRGHRRTFLLGLGVFSAGAVAAAAASSIPLLVAGRGVQGVGAAFILVSGLALVSGSFGEAERSQAVGVYMGLTAVATAAGPALGGLLVDIVSWRAIFVAPLVLPVAAAFVTYAAVPDTALKPNRRVDGTGALLAFAAVCTLSFTLIRGPAGWLQAEVVVALAAAVISAVAFVRSERRATDPMLPLELFRNRTFAGGNAVTLLSFTVSAGAFFFVIVQLQSTLGYRPLTAGAAFVPLYVIMLIGSPLSGHVADGIGARIPIIAGNLVVATATWLLSHLGPDAEFLPDVLPGLLLLAVGLATLGAPLTSVTLGSLGEDEQGIAAGVNNTVAQLAGLVMIVVLPAAAGLSGQRFDGPDFADGYRTALRICTALSLVAAFIAGVSIRANDGSTPHHQATDAA